MTQYTMNKTSDVIKDINCVTNPRVMVTPAIRILGFIEVRSAIIPQMISETKSTAPMMDTITLTVVSESCKSFPCGGI